MPELPEVETIRRDLSRDLKGKTIVDVEIINSRVIKDPAPAEFKKRLKGKVFKDFIRRAKVLIIEFTCGEYLVIHLRMTGQLVYAANKQANARIIFILSDGKYLNFNDLRLFAQLRLVKDWRQLKFIQELGVEPLEKEFSLQRFAEMLKIKKTKIKPLLMEQKFISGIGNLYAQEALFSAGILPDRPANKLEEEEIKKLYTSIRDVLREGILYRGSSVDNYVNGHGRRGQYQFRLKVYGRQGQPCLMCGAKIEKISLGGRGTCFCSQCQR